MSTKFRSQMKEVMQMAWSFVRKNGYSMSEALKCAWANLKLKAALKVEIGSTSRNRWHVTSSLWHSLGKQSTRNKRY